MVDEWVFKSETYDNCNCAMNCGCQFNLPSTHGYCQSAFVGNIVEGHFNDTPIAGLNWAGLYKWPGAIAEGHGLRVMDVAEAVKASDVIMIAVPDTVQKAVYDTDIAPNLRTGQLLMFAHGFNIRFGRIVPPDDIDVGMVAPKGPGHLLRSVYVSGGGVPALFAVHQDPSGTARARVLAYARGLGSTWAGAAPATEPSAIAVRPVASECVAAPSGACYPSAD